jgi:uncharacterized paraquat-inducible protein A
MAFMECTNCTTQCPTDSVFCPRCGWRLKKKLELKKKLGTSGFIAILVAVVGVLIGFNGLEFGWLIFGLALITLTYIWAVR